MKIEKNKIVFGSVVLIICNCFLSANSNMVIGNGDNLEWTIGKTEVRNWNGSKQQEYSTQTGSIRTIPKKKRVKIAARFTMKILDSSGRLWSKF